MFGSSPPLPSLSNLPQFCSLWSSHTDYFLSLILTRLPPRRLFSLSLAYLSFFFFPGSQSYFLRESLSWPSYLGQILHYWHSEHHGSNLHRTHHKCNFTTLWLFDKYPLPLTRLALYGKASIAFVFAFIQHCICKTEHST